MPCLKVINQLLDHMQAYFHASSIGPTPADESCRPFFGAEYASGFFNFRRIRRNGL